MPDEWLQRALDDIKDGLEREHKDQVEYRREHAANHKELDNRVRTLETGMAAMGVKIGAFVGLIVIGIYTLAGQIIDWLRG